MELELRQNTIHCWETVCHTTLEQEETSETIVPDACPDIWQVLDGEGRLFLQRKEPLEDRAEFSGLIKVEILYQPEGEEAGARSIEVTLPFSMAPELPGLTRRCQLVVRPGALTVDIHLLNPRKVLVRAGFSLEVQGYAAQGLNLCAAVEDEETYGMRQKTDSFASFLPVAVQEKPFTYSDTLTIPAGQPDGVSLVKTRADCVCNEARVVGSKLVFKGEARLSLLYRGENGQLCPVEFSLPYSQIMDAGEDAEEAVCNLQLLLTDMKCALEEDQRTLSVNLELLAQAVLWKQQEQPMLIDLYSTAYALDLQRREYPVCTLDSHNAEQETFRETLNLGTAPTRVLDVQIRPGRNIQGRDDQKMVLTKELEVYVLYVGEEGLGTLHRTVSVSHALPNVGMGKVTFTTQLLRKPTATPAGMGIEVSFAVEFQWMDLGYSTVTAVEQVQVGEKFTREEECPSVIIRAIRDGETLWDVAKAYRSTDGEIMEVNGLTSGELYPGQMLLVPGKVGG